MISSYYLQIEDRELAPRSCDLHDIEGPHSPIDFPIIYTSVDSWRHSAAVPALSEAPRKICHPSRGSLPIPFHRTERGVRMVLIDRAKPPDSEGRIVKPGKHVCYWKGRYRPLMSVKGRPDVDAFRAHRSAHPRFSHQHETRGSAAARTVIRTH
jgi:hypothetical protein